MLLLLLSGQPSKSENHPDFVPSVFTYKKAPSLSSLDRYNRNEQRRKCQREASTLQHEMSKQARLDSPSIASEPPGESVVAFEEESTASAQRGNDVIDEGTSMLAQCDESVSPETELSELKERLQLLEDENCQI